MLQRTILTNSRSNRILKRLTTLPLYHSPLTKENHETRSTKPAGFGYHGPGLVAVVMNSRQYLYPARVSGERRGHLDHDNRLAFLAPALRRAPPFGAVVLRNLCQEDCQPPDDIHGLVFPGVHGLLLDLVCFLGRPRFPDGSHVLKGDLCSCEFVLLSPWDLRLSGLLAAEGANPKKDRRPRMLGPAQKKRMKSRLPRR